MSFGELAVQDLLETKDRRQLVHVPAADEEEAVGASRILQERSVLRGRRR